MTEDEFVDALLLEQVSISNYDAVSSCIYDLTLRGFITTYVKQLSSGQRGYRRMVLKPFIAINVIEPYRVKFEAGDQLNFANGTMYGSLAAITIDPYE